MTVARLRAEMSESEFVLWSRYYARKAQAVELESKKAGGDVADKIQITGLRELQAALKRTDATLPKQLRIALNKASDGAGDRLRAAPVPA
jgi:hypothetical protein